MGFLHDWHEHERKQLAPPPRQDESRDRRRQKIVAHRSSRPPPAGTNAPADEIVQRLFADICAAHRAEKEAWDRLAQHLATPANGELRSRSAPRHPSS